MRKRAGSYGERLFMRDRRLDDGERLSKADKYKLVAALASSKP